ncbi:MAG: amidohydrolase family protein [Bilophila wadsworthia]
MPASRSPTRHRRKGAPSPYPGRFAGPRGALPPGGCQIAIHTNGDNAIEEAINAIEKAQAAYPRPDARHMLIHCQMASEEQLDRMAKLGIIANFFVGHVHVWGDLHRDRFIGERALRMDPVASAKKRNMPFCLHTDLPVTPLIPSSACTPRPPAAPRAEDPRRRSACFRLRRPACMDRKRRAFDVW